MSFSTEPVVSQPADDIAVTWGVVDNYVGGKSYFESKLTLRNVGPVALGDDWTLYFNFIRRIRSDSLDDPISIRFINGSFYEMRPDSGFVLPPGDSVTLRLIASPWAIRESAAPSGFYIIRDDGIPRSVDNVRIEPFIEPRQMHRHRDDLIPVATAENRYETNERVSLLSSEHYSPVVPTPRKLTRGLGFYTLSREAVIRADPEAGDAASYLGDTLLDLVGWEVRPVEDSADADIRLRIDPGALDPSACLVGESYVLGITEGGIRITGCDAAGLFYGIQTLLALIDPAAFEGSDVDNVSLPFVEISDQPRFPYRGLMIDVARHFHPADRIKQTIRLMALYKLNKLHLHLSDDEGWRLPVADLPELTAVGGRRGHTLDSREMLPPSFGSGPDPDASPGSGFYTREEFLDLLRFAGRHHIEIIPEIDSPGHLRAAIKSMEHRYRRLEAEGRDEEARAYLLTDLEDASEYRSVQGWDDNVANVCLESTFRFMRTVIDELIGLFEEAHAPLTTVHLGGDEVPPGVWEKSPACDRLLASREDLGDVHDLSADFYRQLVNYLESKGLKGAGWEEIGLDSREVDGTRQEIPKTDLAGKVVPYAWNSVWGWGGEERAYKLANAGYDVVMANVPNLYFDLAAEKHPEEPGFAWGGFVDERKIFEMTPMNVYNSAYDDLFGHSVDPDRYVDAVRLTAKGAEHILGVQGQLWGENTPSKQRFEYHLYPKMLALAERAWAEQPEWETVDERKDRLALLDQDWNRFANSVGQRELLRLSNVFGGVAYRIPPPGGMILDGMLHANVAFPGLQVRYTVDDSEPTVDSALWTEPTEVAGPVRIRTFDAIGHGGRTVVVKSNHPQN